MPDQSTTTPDFRNQLPPDPYAIDPWSWAFVMFRPLAEWPGYGIDTDGFVWSCWNKGRTRARIRETWYRLSLTANPKSGKVYAVMHRDGKLHSKSVHRLVLETFIGPCPPGMESCHRDDCGTNNRLRNLRWDTHVSNMKDRANNGRTAVGARVGRARYSEETMILAKALMVQGLSPTLVAKMTKVSRNMLYCVKHGRNWKHLD